MNSVEGGPTGQINHTFVKHEAIHTRTVTNSGFLIWERGIACYRQFEAMHPPQKCYAINKGTVRLFYFLFYERAPAKLLTQYLRAF